MSARDQILGRIGSALGRDKAVLSINDDVPSTVKSRLTAPPSHTLPAIPDDTIAVLIEKMESVLMSVVRLQTRDDVVKAVEWYCESNKLDGDITVAPALKDLDWSDKTSSGAASGEEAISVTPCLAAVAETGSIVTASSGDTPATLNFLPETHILVLHENQIVRHVDGVFDHLRALDSLPRALNFITGPSRTADIEQTIEIGAHGPRRMHVLLIASDAE